MLTVHKNTQATRISEELGTMSRNNLKSWHIDFSFLCVCPLIEDKFRHNIVKVYCRTTRLRLQATLTKLWCNLSSMGGQMHKKLTSICFYNNKAPKWSNAVNKAKWILFKMMQALSIAFLAFWLVPKKVNKIPLVKSWQFDSWTLNCSKVA